MDLSTLVTRAARRDARAFTELTRRFRHFAFGAALSLVGDFHRAEEVAQEAFLAAWRTLPGLENPAAFPGWLRGIVRHQAFRLLRRRDDDLEPLDAAENVPDGAVTAEERLDGRRHAAAALAAMAALPPPLREAMTLYYLHDCSQQDIATFLKIPLTTVNNRLHAARTALKKRMLAMVKNVLSAHALPDDFVNRIGRLIAAEGGVIEALFDPAAPPALLAELAISDEAGRRGVAVQVMQRQGNGTVRAAGSLPPSLPRGAAVLSTGRQSPAPLPRETMNQILTQLAASNLPEPPRLIETGIKAIDVLCPLVAGGTVVLTGGHGVGLTVLMEELVRRLSRGPAAISLVVLVPPPSAARPVTLEPGYSIGADLRREGYGEGTEGTVRTWFLRGNEHWTPDDLAALAAADTVIHLAHPADGERVYPAIDPAVSRSRLLSSSAAAPDHVRIAGEIRDTLAAPASERALKLRLYLGQPFGVAERYTGRAGAFVPLAEALADCRDILDGGYDDLPPAAFGFAGSMVEIRSRAGG